MVLFWFLLALVLLVLAIVLLRLDAKQRGGGAGREREAAAEVVRSEEQSDDDDDEAPSVTPPADEADHAHADAEEPGAPRLAPFQRSAGSDVALSAQKNDGSDDQAVAAPAEPAAPAAPVVSEVDDPSAHAVDAGPVASAPLAPSSSDPAPLDPAEPSVESSPRLLDKVRALLPARRQNGRAPEVAEQPPVDPLEGSPVVRWLEDREFEPTPTPAPEFRHGDFALGLSALGTVSHGMFRGRRAIMGVTGGRTVLAMRRDTASDVVLDLSRPDVDSEPGFHDAGEVGVLEARTSDYGRLDLIDRDRLAEALSEVPAGVRRIWAEAEWVAATIDGVDDPSAWDDVVAALHAAADVLAPFPPIGGRARALSAEIDPGAPGASSGPDADPTVGMEGEVGTGTQSAQAAPEQSGAATGAAATTGSEAAPGESDDSGDSSASAGSPADSPAPQSAPAEPAEPAEPADPAEPAEPAEPEVPEPRRTGHLRLVPDRSAARDLTAQPVVADRGDAEQSEQPGPAEATQDEPPQEETAQEDAAQPESTEPEYDPFAEIMEPSGPVPARGDVAADHLAPRPLLSRPTRGAGQAYPEDASVPPLAAGAYTGSAGIKPLGSEDDEDEIRGEVERFDAARIDGGSDFDERSTGRGAGSRHGADDVDPSEVTQRLSVADLAARMGVDPADMRSEGRRRRAKSEDGDGGETAGPETDGPETASRERPGIDPDVEQTAKLRLPPDIRD